MTKWTEYIRDRVLSKGHLEDNVTQCTESVGWVNNGFVWEM